MFDHVQKRSCYETENYENYIIHDERKIFVVTNILGVLYLLNYFI